jgi:hypothetical protein
VNQPTHALLVHAFLAAAAAQVLLAPIVAASKRMSAPLWFIVTALWTAFFGSYAYHLGVAAAFDVRGVGTAGRWFAALALATFAPLAVLALSAGPASGRARGSRPRRRTGTRSRGA